MFRQTGSRSIGLVSRIEGAAKVRAWTGFFVCLRRVQWVNQIGSCGLSHRHAVSASMPIRYQFVSHSSIEAIVIATRSLMSPTRFCLCFTGRGSLHDYSTGIQRPRAMTWNIELLTLLPSSAILNVSAIDRSSTPKSSDIVQNQQSTWELVQGYKSKQQEI